MKKIILASLIVITIMVIGMLVVTASVNDMSVLSLGMTTEGVTPSLLGLGMAVHSGSGYGQYGLGMEDNQPAYYITGTVREIRGNLTEGATVTLNGGNDTLTDEYGNYTLSVTALGSYSVEVNMLDFREETQNVTVDGNETLKFVQDHAIIPDAPNMWYALECINRWLYPPGDDRDLTMWRALDAINAWLYPV